ncbi:MAG: hypothetical protein JSU63_21525 [Phycisphaerales bacterium]|nr:MAG: hypothetical protein JSU63_21525 [Phycisphaerales bacterium]
MANITNALRVTVGCALVLGGGCCASREAEVWTPTPRVQWADISTRAIPGLYNGYRILLTEPSQGLFPATIAVTRVALELTEREPFFLRRRLTRDPRNEFLAWNTAFDDQMAISEVFPIAERDLGGARVDPPQIIAANRALKSRIAIVYAMNELSETESEMFGVVYNVNAVQPIAVVHAHAESIAPPEDKREPVDLFETDSRALVRDKFERLVHSCVRELILQDQPTMIESPEGWMPAGPIQPVEWPPRQFRVGR